MGLDAVELVMELEDEFGISIPDDVAVYTRTLGQMHDYLLTRCAGRKRTDCPTRSVFYRLRNALGSVLGVEPRSIRPRTPLLPLLGKWKRKRVWNQIERELSLSLPPLENQAGIGVLAGMAIASLSGFVAATIPTGDVFLGLGVGLVCSLPGVLVGYIVGLCVPSTVSSSCETAGGLARCVVAVNYETFAPSVESTPPDDPIWNRLCDVVVRQLGVKRDVLHRHTRFVEDIGL